MPIFSGRFAAWIIYPIARDYVFSVTLASAITMTVMIVIMCVLVNQFLKHRLNCFGVKALLLEGMFIVSLFSGIRAAVSHYSIRQICVLRTFIP